MISKLEELLRLSSESHADVTICDHEGKDIQIDALVDRYYQHPEDYFICPSYGGSSDPSG